MQKLSIVKPSSDAEKSTHTTLDTVELTPSIVKSWEKAIFQRPVRVNAKVQELANEIRVSGVLPGVLTIGVMGGKRYTIDGQHRIEAFLISGIEYAYADVRFFFCSSMADMGDEFRLLNSRLVSMRPDDILRALEGSSEALRLLRSKCRFIGYDMIRRNENSPILSMSLALRMWHGATCETPAAGGSGASTMAARLTSETVEQLSGFLLTCVDAWGRDAQYARLWSTLNLMICGWLYQRTVITQHSFKSTKLTREEFRKGLMALSADNHHLDYLVGRSVSIHNNAPTYKRIKAIFVKRLTAEMGSRPNLPQPEWAGGHS